ncbi:hypothetical protein [Phyllobacterium phragmitis]|uniref:hypothetical protein n=1 Tax=Phyllobacterium phragmitis TaxID=2670329 RepID=UPI0018ED2451|nr:hypothetical protein [Phyllobacterium phragmitis]
MRKTFIKYNPTGTFVSVRTPETSLFNYFRLRNPDGTLEPPKLERETARRRPTTKEETAALFGQPKEANNPQQSWGFDGEPP